MNTRQKPPADLNKWCRYIVFMILAHVFWYLAARSVLVSPPEIYLRNYIILPGIGFFFLNSLIEIFIRSDKFSLTAKEYLSISLFIILSFYLSITHIVSKALLCSFVLPIFISTIFSNVKITRWTFSMSVTAVLLVGVKVYLAGKLNSDMLMEIFVACSMFLSSYLLAKVLIQYGHDNLTAVMASNEEAMNAELAFLQAQIKPHFLYNAINTMVSFCYTDGEKAANLLVSFSKYLRLIFDVNHKLMMVPLERELELIKVYTEIEKARFGELISVEYDIDWELLGMEVPSFCIQPLVENAIKHGLLEKDSGGTVFIAAKKDNGTITITVTDTGAGMPADKLNGLKNIDSINKGVGLINVIRRIKGWKNAQIDIQSTEGQGTTVSFNIPAKYC